MHSGLMPGLIVLVATAAYVGFLVLIITLVMRRRRLQTAQRNEVIAQAFAGAGARHVGTGISGGVYRGTENEYDLGGDRVFAKTYPVSRYHYRVNLRVAAVPMPWITVYPEGAVQRFGKAIGLNREVQTGDQAFDDLAYVDTIEEDGPVKQVLEIAAVRDGIRGLLELGYKVTLSAAGLETFRLYAHGTPPDVSRVAEATALLAKTAPALPRLDRASFRGQVVGVTMRLVALMFAWIPLLVLAGALDGIFNSPGARTLNAGNKAVFVLLGAATAWGLYVALVALWVRGRSYALPVVALVGFFGLFGIPAAGVMSVLALNQGLDGSAAEAQATTVIKTSKYKRQCRVHLRSWLKEGGEQSFPISCKARDRFPDGSSLSVKQHPGALGMPWIEPVHTPE